MPSYKAPVADVLFLLDHVLNIQNYNHLSGFADATPDVIEAILQEGAKVCEEVLAPLNQSGDREGCQRHDDGTVKTPKGFVQAYQTYIQGGWLGLSAPEAYGGQNLPYVLSAVMNEFAASSNMGFSLYPGLSMSAIAALHVHGTDTQKQMFLPKLVEGVWSGTMNLTEPHCGTDLGLLTTKASRNEDGSYAISGTKIFISAGEHDLTQNIIHLVLARTEGAPSGTKGISLFVVPKFLINKDGSAGAHNNVQCGSIEHKMGIHGNATCVMNYDGATGWLVGEENRGLNAMFVMMNDARLGVAVQGLSQSELAYQNALAYAKERLQGRALSGAKQPNKPADPLLVHPDIRRLLLEIKACNEAGRALILWTALKADIASRSLDPQEKQKADDLISLVTPVLKGVLTDLGFEGAVKAQQVLGGHGYIQEWGLEQMVRDARIAMIYEGANGIQAMDLVGRKLPRDGGRAIMAFFQEVGNYCNSQTQESMKPYIEPLQKGLKDLQTATLWFMQHAVKKPDNAGAGAYAYMNLFGLVAMGYMWARIVEAALKQIEQQGSSDFLQSKLLTGRFFMERLMPETTVYLQRIQAGCETMMAFEDGMF